jgi:2'-5' RNA ligase
MKERDFSLWVMPSGSLYQALSECIESLSLTYRGPVFEPHVTVIGNVRGTESNVVAKTGELAEILEPYSLVLESPDYFDEFFKCIFLRVVKTHEVIQANSSARKVFNHQDISPYQPHLSLFYGKLPVDTKKEIVDNLKSICHGSFVASSIQLFSIEDDLKSWYLVHQFSLVK